MFRLAAFRPKLWGGLRSGKAVCISGTKQLIAYIPKRSVHRAIPEVLVPGEGEGISGVPKREAQVQRLRAGDVFDVLVIGGGATGCGVALDAATRGLEVACVERGDFAEATSSRSSKLLWGGSKYIATAAAQLFSWESLRHPFKAVAAFFGEMKMVYHCHQERTYMMETHPHLVNWIPLAIPFRTWIMSKPVLDHPLFAILPLIAPAFTKFYDSLSGFRCPPSYVLTSKKAKETFPMLEEEVKYCAVLYEGQHNDARTCASIGLTAASKGAAMGNYVEVIDFMHEGGEGHTATGAKCRDRITGEEFEVGAKEIIFCGGAFTDSLRSMAEPGCPEAVNAGAGCHIVLPGYYSPNNPNMGLADMRTSRGAFLFFLPWMGSTVVGTTDRKSPAQDSPGVPEDEIQYLLNEVGRYLTDDLQVRRSDVLSAWRGWRPLPRDPHAQPGDPVSRDHLISVNPHTGITFIAGGKWTTYREMAEHAIDKILTKLPQDRASKAGPCVTKKTPLIGGEGFDSHLSIKLIQQYGCTQVVANHLVSAYGTRATDVCARSRPTGRAWPRYGRLLAEGYPYIESEVAYACDEYCRNVKDILCLRTRLAYLNSTAALEAVPRVAELMAEHLGWSAEEQKQQEEEALAYIGAFGGPVADKTGASLRAATKADINVLFEEIDADGSGYLDEIELGQAAEGLGFPFKTVKERQEQFAKLDTDNNGRINKEEFAAWWNSEDNHMKDLAAELAVDHRNDAEQF